jgi:urease accessory protein
VWLLDDSVVRRGGVAVLTRIVLAATAGFAALSPAAAHHPMGAKTPGGWLEGLLSGLGHPILGVDHLAFIVLMGLVASYLRGGHQIASTFAAALVAGVGGHLLYPHLPMVEVMVAGSTLVAGAALAQHAGRRVQLWTPFVGLAGFVHGYALGEPVAASPLSAVVLYLAGLALCSVVIIMAARAVADRGVFTNEVRGVRARVVGGTFAALGMVFVASAITVT